MERLEKQIAQVVKPDDMTREVVRPDGKIQTCDRCAAKIRSGNAATVLQTSLDFGMRFAVLDAALDARPAPESVLCLSALRVDSARRRH